MSDTDERRAGSIILRDLSLFNKAFILSFDKISLAVCRAISDLVSEWLQRSACRGETDASDYLGDIWICPAKWEQEGEEPFAKFRFCERPGVETQSLVIADLCGVGQTGWGFKFEPNYSWFGGRTTWNTFAKGLGELGDGIVKRGWINEGKGVFFRPVTLNAELLADAWETEDWDGALAPIGQGLDAVLADQHLFDQMIERAKPGPSR